MIQRDRRGRLAFAGCYAGCWAGCLASRVAQWLLGGLFGCFGRQSGRVEKWQSGGVADWIISVA